MEKKPKPLSLLAIKRPTPPATEQSKEKEAPSPPLAEGEESSESANHTPESRVKEETKPKLPPLVTVPEATNAAGEVLHVGDQILVSAPWGERGIAEITLIYQGKEEIWVEYKPVGSVRKGWSWERGSTTAVRLVKCSMIELAH